MIHLPSVTLAIVDTRDTLGALNAIRVCTSEVFFGHVTFCGKDSWEDGNFTMHRIAPLDGIEAYSRFIFKELADYVVTPHCLVIQADGFIVNPKLWDDEWLKYDYIGAPWGHRSGLVGNGGFSLRSLRLMKELQSPYYDEVHPEDDRICRLYGSELMQKGYKFAPTKVAERFSWEGNGHPYTGATFGMHGIRLVKANIHEKRD